MSARLRQARGQASIETLMLMVLAVGVLVVMMVYVQRAYNGYLFSNAAAQGAVPFDPSQPYQVNRRLALNQTQQVTITSGPTVTLPGGGGDLPSVPGGAVSGRTVATRIEVQNAWDVCGRAAYGAGASLPAGCPPP